MIVRITRAKVGHRQAPATPEGPRTRGPFGFNDVDDDELPEVARVPRLRRA